MNLGVRPQHVWKGSLPDPEGEVYVERPHQAPLDELMDAAPLGARVLVFGELVPNARELADPLEADGFEVTVEQNLLQVPPYGLMIEGADGRVIPVLARHESDHARIVEGLTFDAAIEVVAAAARQL